MTRGSCPKSDIKPAAVATGGLVRIGFDEFRDGPMDTRVHLCNRRQAHDEWQHFVTDFCFSCFRQSAD
jgi:hypothetical protein